MQKIGIPNGEKKALLKIKGQGYFSEFHLRPMGLLYSISHFDKSQLGNTCNFFLAVLFAFDKDISNWFCRNIEAVAEG